MSWYHNHLLPKFCEHGKSFASEKCGKKFGREKCSLGLPNFVTVEKFKDYAARDCNALDLQSFPPFRVEKSGDQEHCSPLHAYSSIR